MKSGAPIRWLALAVAAVLLILAPCSSAKSLAQKRALAQAQYSRAENLKQQLEAAPESQRTRRDYERVITAYERVYLITPNYARTDASIFQAAQLLQQMGIATSDPDASREAIKQYKFLMDQYPGTRYKPQAMIALGDTYRDLGDNADAKTAYEDFLKVHPKHPLSPKALAAIEEIEQPAKAAVAKKPGLKETVTKSPEAQAEPVDQSRVTNTAEAKPDDSRRTMVTGIRHWSTPNYTRVAIDLGDEVPYEAGRVPSPDRIFFDLHGTKLNSDLFGKTIAVDDGFLKKIRVAQYQRGMTRIVLEVAPVSQYSAFFLPNPWRLIIDVHGREAAPSSAMSPTATLVAGTPVVKQVGAEPAAPSHPADLRQEATSSEKAARISPASAQASISSAVLSNNIAKPASAAVAVAERSAPVAIPLTSAVSAKNTTAIGEPTPEIHATGHTTTAPIFESVVPASSEEHATAKLTARAANEAPVFGHEARPVADGERTLIRALGLKIGKIVVDAGHGGHDTGTIGPSGLMEKDLVLDVALRLGKLLEQRLGADVVYTRKDDTFIPLETRTAIANENQADLFISIHANSSRDESARGIETYYLNFTSSPDALEVAARENAVSDQSIHELQDLVKKIALKEKIEESREFAADVDHALHTGLSARRSDLRDRGVKKAPFIVLIGANMPSVLAEISFLSNPKDERKLKTPEYREKIAESLYHGIADYVHGLSGVKMAAAGAAGQ